MKFFGRDTLDKNPSSQTVLSGHWHLHVDEDGFVDYALNAKGKQIPLPYLRGIGDVTMLLQYLETESGKVRPVPLPEWAGRFTFHFSKEYFDD